MRNNRMTETLKDLLNNEKALKIMEDYLISMPQNEDGYIWGHTEQVARIVGILNIAYHDNLKLDEVIKNECFEDGYTGGKIVVGIEHSDGTIFTAPIEGDFYLELYKD